MDRITRRKEDRTPYVLLCSDPEDGVAIVKRTRAETLVIKRLADYEDRE